MKWSKSETMSLDATRLALERELLASLRAQSADLEQPQVRMQLHALFLEQAQGLLQPLMEEVRDWTAGQIARPSQSTVVGLKRLQGLAQDRQEPGLVRLAEALHDAVVRAIVGNTPVSAAACLRAVEELHRLLHQYAVGVSRAPSDNVMADLR
ncbi:MAG: hypothetical protein ACKOWD_05785 [Rhodoferax sp.]